MHSLDFHMQNMANTGVLLWGDRVFALYEAGLPHELDPKDLSTVGENSLDGSAKLPMVHAHYRSLQQADGSKRLVSFATDIASRGLVSLATEGLDYHV